MAILMVAILYQVFVDKLDSKYKYHNLSKYRILAHIQKILNEEFSHYFNLQGEDSEESLLLLQVCIQIFFILSSCTLVSIRNTLPFFDGTK